MSKPIGLIQAPPNFLKPRQAYDGTYLAAAVGVLDLKHRMRELDAKCGGCCHAVRASLDAAL